MGHEDQTLLELEDLDLPLPQLTESKKKHGSSKSSILYMCGTLLAVALCAAAAVCFTFIKSPDKQDGENYLRHALRSSQHQGTITAKSAIHLIGAHSNTGKPNLEWKDNRDQAFSAGGLKVVNNEIIIPHDGLYFVYSQVFFNIQCKYDPDPEDQIVHLSHTVFRYSDSYGSYKALFSAVRSVCVKMPDSDDQLYNTIYLGAAFRLKSNDRLNTTMKEDLLPHIETEHGKTYFGAFAI